MCFPAYPPIKCYSKNNTNQCQSMPQCTCIYNQQRFECSPSWLTVRCYISTNLHLHKQFTTLPSLASKICQRKWTPPSVYTMSSSASACLCNSSRQQNTNKESTELPPPWILLLTSRVSCELNPPSSPSPTKNWIWLLVIHPEPWQRCYLPWWSDSCALVPLLIDRNQSPHHPSWR